MLQPCWSSDAALTGAIRRGGQYRRELVSARSLLIVREAKPATAALGARRSPPVLLVQVRGRVGKPTGITRGLIRLFAFSICLCAWAECRIGGSQEQPQRGQAIVEMEGRSAGGCRDEAEMMNE